MGDTRAQMVGWRRLRARFRFHDIEDAHLRRLARAIESLPDPLHDIYCLRRFEGLAIGEIAEQLGLSEAQAWRQLARAMVLVSRDAARQERAAARWRRLWPFGYKG
jgi:DNA-directed RNA polymerase specialized sigma24 family protein